MTDKLQLRVPKGSDLAYAVTDALQPANIAPFAVTGLGFALLTNILTALAATAVYAYTTALWARMRTNLED